MYFFEKSLLWLWRQMQQTSIDLLLRHNLIQYWSICIDHVFRFYIIYNHINQGFKIHSFKNHKLKTQYQNLNRLDIQYKSAYGLYTCMMRFLYFDLSCYLIHVWIPYIYLSSSNFLIILCDWSNLRTTSICLKLCLAYWISITWIRNILL